MKSSGSPCPLDQISIISFKRCPYLRTYITEIIKVVWSSGTLPNEWKKACTVLAHKKGDPNDPANFRPITLESIPLKIFTSALRNSIFEFLRLNNFVEHEIQKGFMPKLSGTLEHTSLMAHIIDRARARQRSLVITLLDLKNAFGEVHHNLISKVLRYHHIPIPIQTLIENLYTDFKTSVLTSEYHTSFLPVGRGVLQGDCLSPLLFNMCFNTFIQYIKDEKFRQFGYSNNNDSGLSFRPVHWFQFADDAAVITGQERENQLLLNCFTIWCQWAGMTIRVDKCVTFGMRKGSTKSTQFQPKLIINSELVPPIMNDDSFRYLGRYFDFEMSNGKHKSELVEILGSLMSDIDKLPMHPKNKLHLYQRYVLSKISWHLTVANISKTWVCEHLDNMVSKYIRQWLELPVSATLSTIFLSKTKFGLNIQLPSTKFMQCQVILRNALKSSTNQEVRDLWRCTSSNMNVQYDTYQNSKGVLKDFRASHEERLQNHLVSQGSFFSFVTDQSLLRLNSIWSTVQSKMPKNIFNFTIRYINNSLPTRSNLSKWGITSTSECSFCLNTESLLHIVAGCKTYLDQGRFTWRHDSVLHFIAQSFKAVQGVKLFSDLPGYLSPSILTGDTFRPDLLLLLPLNCLYVLELTVGYESNLYSNAVRKEKKYQQLMLELRSQYKEVHFVNLSMGALGVMSNSSTSFLDMMKDLGFDENTRLFVIRRLMAISIRATYFIFCRRNKDWPNPDHLTF